jgi:putative selenate reductase
VCPNDANFAFALPRAEIPVVKLRRDGEGWARRREGMIRIEEKHQIGNFADLCNECGNCDVFCPEDGGPHRAKARFFGSVTSFRERAGDPGFYVERRGGRDLVLARFPGGAEHRLEIEGDRATYTGEGFRVSFSAHDPEGTIEGEGAGEIDLSRFRIMDALREAVLRPEEINFVSCMQGGAS